MPLITKLVIFTGVIAISNLTRWYCCLACYNIGPPEAWNCTFTCSLTSPCGIGMGKWTMGKRYGEGSEGVHDADIFAWSEM